MEIEECAICLEEYSSTHMPQLLPCSHNICSVCIETLPTNEQICPLCRNPYTRTEITPNFDLIEKIMKAEYSSLGSLQLQFEKRLDEMVQIEIDKQLKCINMLNQIENQLIELFSGIRKKLNDAMDFNSIVKHNTMIKLREDIDTFATILKQFNFRYNETADYVKVLENKYKEADIDLVLSVFDTESIQNDLKEISIRVFKLQDFPIKDSQVSLFGKTSVPLVYTSPSSQRTTSNRHNMYLSKILFNPGHQNLTMYNMQKQTSINYPHNYIRKESRCIHLHPQTVCVVTPDHILYIDIEDETHQVVYFRSLWEGFCLGRYKGDLTIIGGNRLASECPGQEALYRFKRREWMALPQLREQRMYASCECMHNKIFVFGGNYEMTIEVFYANSWTVLPVRLQSAFSHMVTCTDHDSIYILGGITPKNEISKTIYQFNISDSSLTALDSIDYELISDSNVSACWVNNQIFYNIGESLYQYEIRQ